jgi:hypothetical protein
MIPIDDEKGVGVDQVLGIALTIIVWIGTFVLDTTLVMIYFVLILCSAEIHHMIDNIDD